MILWRLKLGITMLIHNKDDIEFVTEFPCFFGTPCIYIVELLLPIPIWFFLFHQFKEKEIITFLLKIHPIR